MYDVLNQYRKQTETANTKYRIRLPALVTPLYRPLRRTLVRPVINQAIFTSFITIVHHNPISNTYRIPLSLPAKDMNGLRAMESFTIMNEIVLPNDTNTYGNLMGGRLMYWMDIAAAIAAGKHCKGPSMTASVDNISFKTSIKLGDVVHIEAKLTRAFTTSMEIHIRVWGEDYTHQYESNEAYFTFVALDGSGKPQPVPPVIPETKEEQVLYESALRRRQVRLILGGKMKPSEAEELKALFMSQAPV